MNLNLLGELIKIRLRDSELTASEVAKAAGISLQTFSHIRHSRRRVSPGLAEKIANAFITLSKPNQRYQDRTREVDDFLIAAGYAPEELSRRTVELYRRPHEEIWNDSEVGDLEMSLVQDDEIWVLRRSMPVSDKDLLRRIAGRLYSSIKYRFFISRSHALSWLLFQQQLRDVFIEGYTEFSWKSQRKMLQTYIIPDEVLRSHYWQHTEIVYYSNRSDECQLFTTLYVDYAPVEGGYRKESATKARELRQYLLRMSAVGLENDEPPCLAQNYLTIERLKEIIQGVREDNEQAVDTVGASSS